MILEGTDDEEQDTRENRTRVDEEISMACCGLDSMVCKDIVLKIQKKACKNMCTTEKRRRGLAHCPTGCPRRL